MIDRRDAEACGDWQVNLLPKGNDMSRSVYRAGSLRTGVRKRGAMQCPKCRLENVESATHCDCGYAFMTQSTQAVLKMQPLRGAAAGYPNAAQWRVLWAVTAILCLGFVGIFAQFGILIDAVTIGGLLSGNSQSSPLPNRRCRQKRPSMVPLGRP
jgi:hypothetical protein